MVNRALVERLEEWQHSKIPSIVERELKVNIRQDIIAVVGPRRVGKTYLMLQMIEHLRKEGVNPIYVDFEDIIYKDFSIKDIIEAYYEIFEPKEPLYLFIDEVHNLKEWGTWLRSLHNSNKYRIMVTGSTSKLLLKEISTELRGRYISKLLLPFSFKEYLRIMDVKEPADISEDRGRIKRYLEDYMEFGGYPEVIKLGEEFEKREKLRMIYLTTLYRDIIDRCNVREKELLEFILKYMISNTGNKVSVSKLHRIMKSNTHGISKRTVWKYYNYVLDSLSVFEVPSLSSSLKKEMMTPKKVYCVDPGLIGTVSMKKDKGRKLETMVFLHLLRRSNTEDLEIRYLPLKDGEVDFVIIVRGEVKELIQACYDPNDPDTKRREDDALIKAGKDLGCKDLKVITWDVDVKDECGCIDYMPLWKFLLDRP